jgi:Cys-tRNA(Pro)/Cys-tRNA(Cys) deacylase
LHSVSLPSTIRRMQEQPPVAQALTDLQIPHTVFTHPGSVTSLEQAAAERGQQPEQVVRSLLFRLGEGDFAMVLMAGPAQVSWKALRKHFGQSRLTTATEEEVLAVTGYTRGAVAPFGLRQAVRVLIDKGVMQQEVISLGSGTRGTAILLTTADLRRALPAAEVGDFAGE